MNRGGKPAMRGQPLFVFGLFATGWIGLRSLMWQSPFPVPDLPLGIEPEAQEQTSVAAPPQNAQFPRLQSPVGPSENSGWIAPPIDFAPPVNNWSDPEAYRTPAPFDAAAGSNFAPVPPRAAAGHAMLMAAGFAYMEVPEALWPAFQPGRGPVAPDVPAQLVQQEARLPVPFAQASRAQKRWSLDGWLLLRDDTVTPISSGRPSYGRSQAGAVARFELAPSSAHRPQAYLRGSTALEGGRDVEGALGISARPIAGLPVRVAAEARLSDRPEGTEVRPAAFAVTEFPPIDLPGGASAELYVQGGYVGGDYATAFVDGQVRVDRSFLSSENFDLRAGAGAWGGAQEDAARLDVGPSASIRFRLGEGSGRIAADYRFRVAGDAQPSSGPALTLSAGF